MSMRDAVVRGVAKGQEAWATGPCARSDTFAAVIAENVLAELPPSDQEPLSDYVLSVLTTEFHIRIKEALRNLSTQITGAAKVRPMRALPDRIAEWGEDMDQINSAIFEFIEAGDVLTALEYITMPGCDWSTFIEERRGGGD